VRPIFSAAHCIVTHSETGPLNSPANARAIATGLDLAAFDALVPLGGDGIPSELWNGLAVRPDAARALEMPISPVGCGSGNALAVNLLGPDRVGSWAWAALAAVKGQSMAVDLCSVTHGGGREVAFLSVAFGMMADLDFGTEHLRWMGDARFTYGYVKGALSGKKYNCEVAIKIVHGNKAEIAKAHNNALQASHSVTTPSPQPTSLGEDGLPPLRFGTVDDAVPDGGGEHHADLPPTLSPGWHTLRAPTFFAYVGKMPFIAAEVMMFPPAGDDGLIDVALVTPTNPLTALTVSPPLAWRESATLEPCVLTQLDTPSFGVLLRQWTGPRWAGSSSRNMCGTTSARQ